MLALGLRPRRIFAMVYAESMTLASIGLLLGLALALPTVFWFIGHPIALGGEGMAAASALIGMEPVVVFELRDTTLPGTAITILGVAALAALYPAIKASRARPVDALRSLCWRSRAFATSSARGAGRRPGGWPAATCSATPGAPPSCSRRSPSVSAV